MRSVIPPPQSIHPQFPFLFLFDSLSLSRRPFFRSRLSCFFFLSFFFSYFSQSVAPSARRRILILPPFHRWENKTETSNSTIVTSFINFYGGKIYTGQINWMTISSGFKKTTFSASEMIQFFPAISEIPYSPLAEL